MSKINTLEKEIKRHHRQEASAFTLGQTANSDVCLHFKDGSEKNLLPITLRPYQYALHQAFYEKGYRRFFEVLPRRAGKEVESWSLLLKEAVLNPGPYAMIYPTYASARKILWDGFLTDPLTNTAIRFIDFMPKELVATKSKQKMQIILTNGSIISLLGSEQYDRLRGINLKGAVFSEYAWSDPRAYRTLMPIFKNNKGFYILQTTYDGMNHAYRLMQSVKNQSDWFTREASALTLVNENGERYITDAMIEESRRDGMPEYLIQQEYFCAVTLNESIHYFARAMKDAEEDDRFKENIHETRHKVHIAFDLGFDDMMALVFFQLDEYNKPRVIHYYEERRKSLNAYLEYIDRYLKPKNLRKGSLILPHDGANHSIQTGKSTLELLEDCGESVVATKRIANQHEGTQLIREYIYRTTFDTINADRLIECLSHYAQDFDEKRGLYKDTPKHDWSSHGVKAFQTMALALRDDFIDSALTDYSQVGWY
ncbi:hypothetical protein [Candidiatus Paracoxiella cheracis]|uniref:hypothetical protein n=1 Tax=Candidiatus Paracoxiella cheracis TaxID=3405120 RepID=UPI003BF4C6F8